MRALILQHIECEPPGEYETVLRERGIAIDRVELDEGEPLPASEDVDLVIAMGGPMSVNDEDEHPWLRDEKRLIADVARGGRPFWGACLGVQLLAAGLGARVYPGPTPEVGLLPVQLTEEGRRDPVMGVLDEGLLTLQWHGDTFDLPEGAVRLAGSPAYPNQAFRYERAYGIQFHLEVTRAMAEDWARVPAYVAYADRVLGRGSLPDLLEEFSQHESAIRAAGRAMFEAWLDEVATPAIEVTR